MVPSEGNFDRRQLSWVTMQPIGTSGPRRVLRQDIKGPRQKVSSSIPTAPRAAVPPAEPGRWPAPTYV